MSEQEPKPKKIVIPGPPKYNYKPLDELGFFKDPKKDKEIWRRIQCHCYNCETMALREIYKGGVHNVKQMVEIYKIYEESITDVRHAIWGESKEITIKDFTK